MATPEQSKLQREFRKLEEELKRHETRIKRQRVRQETEATHDGRPSTGATRSGEYDPLLEALIKKHPEKDPVNIK